MDDKNHDPRQPLTRNLTRSGTRSRYAPVKPERDMSAIIYNIVLFTLVLFFTTIVGGGIAMKMGWVDGMGPLIEFLKPQV